MGLILIALFVLDGFCTLFLLIAPEFCILYSLDEGAKTKE
jgi:hypothetical protein